MHGINVPPERSSFDLSPKLDLFLHCDRVGYGGMLVDDMFGFLHGFVFNVELLFLSASLCCASRHSGQPHHTGFSVVEVV